MERCCVVTYGSPRNVDALVIVGKEEGSLCELEVFHEDRKKMRRGFESGLEGANGSQNGARRLLGVRWRSPRD